MRKFVIEKTVIAIFTTTLFTAFISFAITDQNAMFKKQENSFQQTWKIEQGNYKSYLNSF